MGGRFDGIPHPWHMLASDCDCNLTSKPRLFSERALTRSHRCMSLGRSYGTLALVMLPGLKGGKCRLLRPVFGDLTIGESDQTNRHRMGDTKLNHPRTLNVEDHCGNYID